MKKWILIGIGFAFLLGACGTIRQPYSPMMGGNNTPRNSNQFSSNGEQIFFTATDQSGRSLSYTGGPAFGGMMGGYYTCATCHGNDGQGGTRYIHMQQIDAPAINYDALIEMKKKDSGGDPTAYSLDDLRGAVIDGHDTAGEQLNQNMPRWQMSDQDLADLLAFLKTLP